MSLAAVKAPARPEPVAPARGASTPLDAADPLHVDWVQELPEDVDVCIAQRDFEGAVDLILKSMRDF